jgi:hypothetical protein
LQRLTAIERIDHCDQRQVDHLSPGRNQKIR